MQGNGEDSHVDTTRGVPELHKGHYQKNRMIGSSMLRDTAAKNPTHIDPAREP
jgi:hypothetical protein